jgi:hypothetical protein
MPMLEVPLPWERLIWTGRSLLPPRTRYALTDFRLVSEGRGSFDELAIHDISDIQRRQSVLDRCLSASTLIVHGRRGRPAFVLRHVRRGAQLAALIELLSAEPTAFPDSAAVDAALAWDPKPPAAGFGQALAGLAVMFTAIFALTIGFHRTAAAIVYPADDAIVPNGAKRTRQEIVEFMEDVVMPWARVVFAPLKGGSDGVTCETCHGREPSAHGWQMPAVAALPEPLVRERGWERHGGSMDAQLRNAIYGYTADSERQTKAAYMREFVMPGMARLLHRPPYDFTKTYEHNRSRFAFGCYHCHRVK